MEENNFLFAFLSTRLDKCKFYAAINYSSLIISPREEDEASFTVLADDRAFSRILMAQLFVFN